MEPTKRCSNCHRTKPRTEFYPGTRDSDGLQTKCKHCSIPGREPTKFPTKRKHKRLRGDLRGHL